MDPAGHMLAALQVAMDKVVAQKLPLGHRVSAVVPAGQYAPAEHGKGVTESGQKLPAGQTADTVLTASKSSRARMMVSVSTPLILTPARYSYPARVAEVPGSARGARGGGGVDGAADGSGFAPAVQVGCSTREAGGAGRACSDDVVPAEEVRWAYSTLGSEDVHASDAHTPSNSLSVRSGIGSSRAKTCRSRPSRAEIANWTFHRGRRAAAIASSRARDLRCGPSNTVVAQRTSSD